jgi:hypothetical protein
MRPRQAAYLHGLSGAALEWARCVHAKLHIFTDYPVLLSSGPEPAPCFPELAVALATAQANAVAEALGSRRLFGFTAARRAEATDLFVATEDVASGTRVFKSLYRGEWMYRCPPTSGQRETWAVSAASERDAWSRCEGRLWIDLASAQAREASSEGVNVLGGVHFDLGLEEGCTPTLSELATVGGATIGQEQPAAETIRFPGEASPLCVACALLWHVGAYRPNQIATSPSGAAERAQMTVQLPSADDPIRLVGDVVVRAGEVVKLESRDGAPASIVVGRHRLEVEGGGRLELDRVSLARSFGSSAVYSEGDLRARNCTFSDCVVSVNAVARFGEGVVPPGKASGRSQTGPFEPAAGALVASLGGAVLLAFSLARGHFAGCILGENAGVGPTIASFGGAIAAFGGSVVLESGTILHQNVARDAYFSSWGGAVLLLLGELLATDVRFFGNEARKAIAWAQGGAVGSQDSTVIVGRSSFESNTCRRAALGAPFTSRPDNSQHHGIAVPGQRGVQSFRSRSIFSGRRDLRRSKQKHAYGGVQPLRTESSRGGHGLDTRRRCLDGRRSSSRASGRSRV